MAYKTIIGPEGAREIVATLKSNFARKPGLDYDKVIDIAFHDLQEKFALKNMNIFLLDSNDEKLIAYRLFNPEIPEAVNQQIYQMPLVLADEPGVVKYILENRIAVFVPELKLDMITSPWGREIFLLTGMKSNLMLPLVIDDVVCGLITFPSYSTPLQLTQQEIEEIERRVLYIAIALNSMFYAIELREKNQIIEDKNRLQRAFMANMSHEIRTPMNAVIGFSSLALKSGLPPRQANYLHKIESSAKSLLGIINDILDFSKIEAGKLDFEHIPFRVEQVLHGVDDIVSVKAAEKGLDLRLDIAPGIPPLLGDPLRLNQVLTNLAGNAIKFTASGQVSLRVELEEQQENASRLRFTISDTGIGMTPAQIAKLFTAFSQADTSITRKYGGSGLGLAISKHLIEMMGGQIRLDSIVGKGSTFSFALDFAHAPAASAAVETAAASTHILELGGARVLLVEDNALNQELMQEVLGDEGLLVDLAGNGAEAIAALEQRAYDLVLMDAQMPVMDGFEATRRIRQDARFAELPIIALTAHAMKGYREECLAVGMNDYLSKPIELDQLFAMLGRWIKPTDRTAPASPPATVEEAPTLPYTGTLPGLDVATALARMRGKQTLYRKLLRGFVADYADCAGRLTALLAAGQIAEAHRLAHTLKGVAGAIAASEVQAVASELEHQLRNRQDGVSSELLAQLATAIHTAVQSANSLI